MKTIFPLLLCLLLASCEDDKINRLAAASFRLGASSLACAIKDNPAVANMRVADQVSAARDWYRRNYSAEDAAIFAP